LSGQPDLIDQDVPGNQKRALILEELEGDQKYINALIEYTGGDPPYRGELRTCKDGRFRLSCVAPLEAIEVYRKWLAVEVIRANLSRVHINLGNAYLMQAEMSDDPGPYLEEALQHFEHAALAGEALDARLARSYIFLRMRRYDDSYVELKEIRSRIPRANSREAEFRELARKTLIGQERFQDADCFADIRNMSHGPRSHCQQMQF
ncbi:MAG: hypothetical protein KDK30_09525, partial [Leptospiraceae bacterium]|nr:hypothetical protein [Leptospiraceae bacterium]